MSGHHSAIAAGNSHECRQSLGCIVTEELRLITPYHLMAYSCHSTVTESSILNILCFMYTCLFACGPLVLALLFTFDCHLPKSWPLNLLYLPHVCCTHQMYADVISATSTVCPPSTSNGLANNNTVARGTAARSTMSNALWYTNPTNI